MESDERETDNDEQRGPATTVEMNADKYENGAEVASDGRLWLGEEWAGETVEVALRKKAE